MVVLSFMLVAGLLLLVGGANVMIRGAIALARAFSVAPVVIGLTIVAFGTSAPELVVNCTAAYSGQPQLAFGNVIGSCTINLGWVLAITALVRPIKVEPSIISREIPMMLLATTAFAVLAADRFFDHAADDLITRGNGTILLLLFGVFLYYTISNAVKEILRSGNVVGRATFSIHFSLGNGVGHQGDADYATGGREGTTAQRRASLPVPEKLYIANVAGVVLGNQEVALAIRSDCPALADARFGRIPKPSSVTGVDTGRRPIEEQMNQAFGINVPHLAALVSA